MLRTAPPLQHSQIEGPDHPFHSLRIAQHVDILSCQAWRLLARGIGVGPADVAHRNLIFIDLRDVVGKGVAGNGELSPVQDEPSLIVGLAGRQDAAHVTLRVLIARLLYLGHASRDGPALDQNFKDGLLLGTGIAQPALYIEYIAERLIFLPEFVVLTQEGIALDDEEIVSLEQFLDDLLERADDRLVAALGLAALLMKGQQGLLQDLGVSLWGRRGCGGRRCDRGGQLGGDLAGYVVDWFVFLGGHIVIVKFITQTSLSSK